MLDPQITEEQMTDLKYCKDCKHSRPSIWERVFTLVLSLKFSNLEVGYGHICKRRSNVKQETLCVNERRTYEDWVDTCGPDAKYYEARK